MRPYGDRAFVVTPPDPVRAAVAARTVPGVVDAIPGARDLVVVCASPGLVDHVARALETVAPQPIPAVHAVVEIPVRYDGPDLADLPSGTAERHAAGTYTVAFMGFTPGFGYLAGLDPALVAIPRRDEPRGRVPAGSVALAGGWTGVYPSDSPGGWHLIGSTPLDLWDLDRDPPALLRPGLRVRFVSC